ncbi:winged helix-turn-helix transcriptional regulator [Streptomyces sp. NPDC091280]|uniref:winged helix-turn-helix transcriptional regulator n=1 Tax=Streptomyces sp. NPDC091280 TaxID=3365984 RepID=UPI0037F9092F
MTLTGLPHDADTDIARVSQALAMITPRWNARILLALDAQPLRYKEIARKVPWLLNGQLHLKLRQLCDAGLVRRTEHTTRHVTYGHTDRAGTLLPVLPLIVTWAEKNLEQPEKPLPAIEQIEDSLTLLTRRHAVALLWVLKVRGESSGRTLARIVMPDSDWTNVYPPLRQLVADGLIDTDGSGHPYRLSAAGDALGPVLGALSAWSAGQPLRQAAHHPVWGRPDAASAAQKWVSNPSRRPVPAATLAPATTGRSPSPAWRHGGLFSHAGPARPPAALPTGGPRR